MTISEKSLQGLWGEEEMPKNFIEHAQMKFDVTFFM